MREEKTNTDLSDNLYNVLIDYQKKILLKKLLIIRFIFMKFIFIRTALYSLSTIGVNLEEKKPYGIYKDEDLKATYVIDDKKKAEEYWL